METPVISCIKRQTKLTENTGNIIYKKTGNSGNTENTGNITYKKTYKIN